MPCGHDPARTVLGEGPMETCPSCEETRNAYAAVVDRLRDSTPSVSSALVAGVARQSRAELAAGRKRRRLLFLAGPLGLAAAALLAISWVSWIPTQSQLPRKEPLAGMPTPDFIHQDGSSEIPALQAMRDCGPRVDGLFRVHEWGLIPLGMGKDAPPGLSLGADLPDFAKRPIEAGGIEIPTTLKPVLYFYPEKKDPAWFSPDITISIPGGKMACFWPPANCPDARTLFWQHNILSLAPDPAKARPVPKGHWMETARDTDSIWLKVRAMDKKGRIVEETERFLFYDGAVPYASPLALGKAKGDTLTVTHAGKDRLHDLMLVRNKDGKTRFGSVGHLAPGEAATLEAKPCEDPADTLKKILVEAGLYEKEAAGMAKIWEKDLFQTEGNWLIWRLDPATIDALQPLTIDPKPVEVVRAHLVLMAVPD